MASRPRVSDVTTGGEFKIEQTQGDFKRLVESLDRVGRSELTKELRRTLNDTSKEARMRVRDDQRAYFPSGMKKKYARVPAQALSTAGRQVSVKWRQRLKNVDYVSLEKGKIRHPLFGNKKYWYSQTIRSGFFTNSVERQVPAMRSEVFHELTAFIDKKVMSD